MGGVMMGFVMKFANNIIRLFIISSAMVVTTALSVLVFGLQLNTFFFGSMSLVVASLGLYYYV